VSDESIRLNGAEIVIDNGRTVAWCRAVPQPAEPGGPV